MTTIALLPVSSGAPGYRAVADGVEAAGDTPGQAIDALVRQTGWPSGTTLIIVQSAGPDDFFSAPQRARLADLMARWRQARDAGQVLPDTEQAELDALTATELRAATARSAAALQTVRP